MATVKEGPIIKFLIKNRLARDLRGANTILLTFAALNLLVTFIVLNNTYNIINIINRTTPTYLEDMPEDVRNTLPPDVLKNIPLKQSLKNPK